MRPAPCSFSWSAVPGQGYLRPATPTPVGHAAHTAAAATCAVLCAAQRARASRAKVTGARAVRGLGQDEPSEGQEEGWRRVLLGEAEVPGPVGQQLRMAAEDLELRSLLRASPELVDTVLRNIMAATEARAESAKSAESAESAEESDSTGGLRLPSFLDFSSQSAASDAEGVGEEAGEVEAGDSHSTALSERLQKKEEADGLKARASEDGAELDGATQSESSKQQMPGAGTVEEALQDLDSLDVGPSLESDDLDALEAERLAMSGGSLAGMEAGQERVVEDWEDLIAYRELLGRLPELKALVRKMGRKAGLDSPMQFEQAERESKAGQGIVRSPLLPAETTGISRSGDLLLPSELSLLAYANAPDRRNAAGARALHRLRRAEGTLLCYERSAWEEEDADRLRWREWRPGAERGPLLCCVDTSRSMAGRPEAIAKAAVLEVLTLAQAEKRPCYVNFFSGPSELAELEVVGRTPNWTEVLAFFSRSFRGGTDLEAPLAASAARLEGRGRSSPWQRADLLLVTDGKITLPSQPLMERLESLRGQGLRLFGLAVQEEDCGLESLTEICDEVHRFEALGRIPRLWRQSKMRRAERPRSGTPPRFCFWPRKAQPLLGGPAGSPQQGREAMDRGTRHRPGLLPMGLAR
ncbi:unnamed protein product [Effrenium voratum]|uniref:VWFA domain-containing protein n=1 Tax=Effrenium voratum TaxID=2562239 RepID=A0AA36HV42_9DINO|nr:unnamed protein product [Effrenium voratum]